MNRSGSPRVVATASSAMKTYVPRTVLAALDEGRLSAEEAVRAALKGPDVLGALLGQVQRRPVRRRSIRRIKTYPAAVVDRALGSVRRTMQGSRTVRSIHWGARQVLGRRTSEVAVVIHVSAKRSPKRVVADGRRLAPRRVSVRFRGRRYLVPVDVQAVGRGASLHVDTARPGGHGSIRVGGEGVGALGAIVVGGGGALFAVTAGHVARAIGSRPADCADVDAGLFPLGSVKCNRLGSGDDVAAIGPVPSLPAGAAGEPTFVRDATSGDVNQRVFVLLPESFTPIESHIDGVGVTTTFVVGSGTMLLRGLTSIDRVAHGGDSGAPVLDVQGNMLGLVVGGDATRTYLMPARRALNALQDCL
jgi:hypothetical protein